MMLQGHFIDTLLDPVYRIEGNPAYDVWSYFRGITAPTFFTISGLVFTYLLLKANAKGNDRPRIKKGLFRGLLLIFIGYSLRVNLVSWFEGVFSPYFLVVDVLQCIGLSLIIIICLHTICKNHSYIFSIVLFSIGCLCFVTEPLYRNLVIDNLPLVIANYMTKVNGSVFTILPWFGYSAFGAFLSTVFFRHAHRTRFKIFSIVTFFVVGLLLMYCSTWFLLKLHALTNIELLKAKCRLQLPLYPFGQRVYFVWRVLCFERFLKQSIIARIGEKTLSIYVIHFIILFGSFTGIGLKRFYNQSLNPTEAIIGAILFIVVVCIMSFYYARTNHFVYNLARKLVDLFKKQPAH